MSLTRKWRWMLWAVCASVGLIIVIALGLWAWLSSNADARIAESVIRYGTKGHSSGDTIFLRIVDTDPSPGFLSRFGDLPWRARPVSAARFREPGRGVFDPETGRDAEIITIEEVRFESMCRAVVWYSSYQASLGGAEYRCLVSWKNGRWVVIEHRLYSIS